MRHILAGTALLGTLLGAGVSLAQDAGEAEYMNYCAACHGEGGTGDGPLADLMTVEVPDLTTMAAGNDGNFPLLSTIQTIDGRTGVRGHGFPMPVWGDRFSAEANENMGDVANELMVRGRVLALATYIQSIQQ